MSKSSIAVIPQLLRAKEDINTLTSYQQSISAASIPRSNKRPVGQLCHRTRSYRSFKLPRRLKQGLNCKKKKLRLQSMPVEKRCRKFRRRRLLLQQVYGHIDTQQLLQSDSDMILNSTNKKPMYLSTHLWHRKRFVMVNRHGIMTAMRSSQRGIKSLQRYSLEPYKISMKKTKTKKIEPIVKNKKDCAMMQDVSYLRPLQLLCSRTKAIDIFSSLLDPMTALHDALMNNKYFQAREYTALLYEPNCFPKSLIGPVNICLKENTENQSLTDVEEGQALQIILWCDPAIVQQVHQAISTSISKLQDSNNVVFASFPVALSRFYLMGGEKVLSILQTLFKQFQHHLEGESDNNQIFFMNAIKSQQVLNNVWRDGQILSLHMNDPRLSKIKAAVSADHVDGKETGASKKIALKWPKTADVSALWTNTKNDSYPCTKHDTIFAQQKQDRDSRWNTITSQLANIFEEKPLDISALIAEGDSVLESFPLMLIRHRPSTNPLNLTDRCLPGFTLIVPEAWSRSVWDRFSHAGFLPVGLEEMHYMQQRHGVLSFPQDYPDTLAGRQYWKDNHTQHSSIQLKKPPSKRTKLTKYSNICDLFYGTTEEENAICFTVVRTLAYLTAFNLSESSLKLDQEQLESILNDINANKTSSSILEALPKLPNTTFVHLLINPTSRGLPRVGAIIYAMTTEDLKAYVKKHCKHKLALQGHVNFANDESKWQGIAFQGNDINREVLGVVTSGYVEHINAHKHEHNGKGGAISMSNVEDLHRYMRNQYELLSFPDAHKMVFFHNPGSQWLRPAKLYFM